jgi:predicted enzyme related to lactoylglutathione lyase
MVKSVELRSVVFDCPDPALLATFYGDLLGGTVDLSDPSWCEVHVAELPMKLAFQRADDFVAPEWPDGQPQQIHLDLTVSDLASASARAIELGARVLAAPVADENSVFAVHADPSGHPFCFCVDLSFTPPHDVGRGTRAPGSDGNIVGRLAPWQCE